MESNETNCFSMAPWKVWIPLDSSTKSVTCFVSSHFFLRAWLVAGHFEIASTWTLFPSARALSTLRETKGVRFCEWKRPGKWVAHSRLQKCLKIV